MQRAHTDTVSIPQLYFMDDSDILLVYKSFVYHNLNCGDQ